MSIPFIDLKRTVRPLKREVLEDWADCLEHTSFVLGPRVSELEERMAAYLSAPPMVACGSGTDAVVVALQGLGVGPGARVALPTLTFWATYEAPAQLGATPVLLDIGEDLHLDMDELERAHEKQRLDALILPQLFGWCAERTDAIRAWCAGEGVALVEDSAQAFGVRQGERSIYDCPVSTISFYPAKVLGGAADGGGLFIADEAIRERVRSLCNHGRAQHYSYAHVGWNSRMPVLNAVFLTRVLERADAILENRRWALCRYAELIAQLDHPRVRMHTGPEGVTGNGYLCVLTVEGADGEALHRAVRERGVGCARTYPETLDQQPPAQGTFDSVGDFSRAREFCRRVINLPLFYGITDDEIEASVSAFEHALKAL